jgi:phenylacetic acid degradation operon negative regulatory protein
MKLDGAAGYALSDAALDLLREGDVRIFSRQRAVVADGLVMVVFSIPESERDKRHLLRSTLTSMGFGTVSPGVWVAPGLLHDEVARTLEHQGLASFVDLFRARYDGFGSLRDRVGEWWDLPAIAALYDEFVADHSSLPWLISPDPARAFTAYVPMLTAWRRLPYLDPGIPLELLPSGWPGVRAGDLFAKLDGRLREPAAKHAHARLEV